MPFDLKPMRRGVVDASHPHLRGCLCWWPMWDGGGTNVSEVLNGIDGTFEVLTGSSWVPGPNGLVVEFTGANNNRIRTFKQVQADDFTAMVWFKSTASSPTAYERLFDKRFTDAFWIGRNGTTPDSWGGGVWEPNAPYGRFVTLPDGEWHHIVSRRRGTTHTIIGDGGAVSTSGTVLFTILGPDFFFFGDNHLQDTEFEGQLSDARFYNVALSDEEINAIYNDPWAPVREWNEVSSLSGWLGYNVGTHHGRNGIRPSMSLGLGMSI